ncbi:MAG TPA: ABC transporter permease [Cyclobacteriaceae bacterium]|nr:ABC transporter permease [Cyclobacteriaceae bacterium]
MLKNHLKIAFRNLLKNPTYSFINIGGLSLGLASSILILLWVSHELSYDKFHTNADRIHQLWVNAKFDGKINSFNSVPMPAKEAVKEADSRIKNTAIGGWGTLHLLSVGENKINIKGQIVSPEFLDIFHFPMTKGSAQTALDDPGSIVLTESSAKALFGNAEPMGQVVLVDNKKEVKVTGILKDLPSNSTLQFNFLLPLELFRNESWVQESDGDWNDNSWIVYVELQPGADKAEVESKIKGLLVKNGVVDTPREFFLHPMPRWRLHTSFRDGKESGGLSDLVQGFTIIAIFILVIACINFMNLATARSESRAREVGIRKTVGSRRSELVVQFIGESVLISTISFILAIAIVELALPLYNNLVGKALVIEYAGSSFWIFAVSMILLTGLLSGSYPAFYLSSFQAIKVLKGKIQVGKNATTPRQVLVVFQFIFAIGLIVGTLIISRQIEYTKNRELGYKQENLLSVWNNEDITKNYKVIKQELLASGVVTAVTKSNSPITDIFANNILDWPGKPADQKVIFTTIATEYDYTKTMGIKMLEGRDFSEDFKSDTAAVMINRSALEVMGLPEPIGTKVTFWGDRVGTIVGVTDNVLMGSPHGDISPMLVVFQPDWVSAISIRLENTPDIQATLKKVEAVFKKYDSAHPFSYSFVDQQYETKFTVITMINRIANLFAFLAIAITGLGLLGLAAFTAAQRTKEIGIRKILGASVLSLVSMIAKEFSWLIVIAFIIAAPVSWWIFQKLFLDQYSYRIDFPWWLLVLSGGVTLLFGLAIVAHQAFKAAVANPVNSLRSE